MCIGGDYCQNYYPYWYNMGTFHKQCITSVSSCFCECKFCWSRNCRDIYEAFAGNTSWKVLVQGTASRQIYAAFCLRADGVCWGVGNTVFIGLVLFSSFGWLCPSLFTQPRECAVVGTLHLIHISKHLVNNTSSTLNVHVLRCIFVAASTPVLLVVFNSAVRCMAVI